MIIRSFLAWWKGELAACVPDSWRRSTLLGMVHIRLCESTADFAWPGAAACTIAMEDSAPPRPWHSRLLPYRKIRITLPDRHALTQTLDLPLAVEPVLASVLELDIDRLSPFAADDVCFSWRVLSRNHQSEMLRVAVHIMSSLDIRALQQRVEHWGLSLKHATVQVEGWPSDSAIPLSGKTDGSPSRPAFGRLNRALAASALLACVWTAHGEWQALQAQSESLRRTIATTKSGVDRVLQLKREVTMRIDHQNKLRRLRIDQPTLSEILTQLAEATDDETWLDQLWFENGTLRLHGQASSATDLITRLDDLPFVGQVRFEAPIVTDIQNDADRFQISAVIGPVQSTNP